MTRRSTRHVKLRAGAQAHRRRKLRGILHRVLRLPATSYRTFYIVRTFGLRVADTVARFGGFWTFVGFFAAMMLGWVGLHAFLLLRRSQTFDSYPYIRLNLLLTMLTPLQATVIPKSQNRPTRKIQGLRLRLLKSQGTK